MYLSDVVKKEECKNEALQELRKLGIKCRPKKPKQHNVKAGHKCFKVPLGLLPTETVTLKTGQQIAVPKLVHELCSFILGKVNTEGIFRKEGSRVRQGEMKLTLNGGGMLDRNLNVVDIAVLLKTFLRELPEPLVPYGYHELFLRCIISDGGNNKNYALLLGCLLLPLEHLNTLTYLMQFFHEVAEHSKKNKMNFYNLAVVISPTILPIEEKLSSQNVQMRTTKICEIVQVLIENAFEIGIIPESIIERLGSNGNGESKKKKRRSGSLTRMFNGLKKMVGGKTVEDNTVVTPDLLLTPINSNAMKKRRIQANGISNKKKKELLNKLPDNVLLNTPFTPCRTPVSMDLSGPRDKPVKDTNDCLKEKKSQWFSRSKSVKNLTKPDPPKHIIHKAINRRWSAISDTAALKKAKKRNSFTGIEQPQNREPDYIRVPKIEYEAIKNRVSAMERRISIELDSVQSQIINDNENNANVEVDDVLNDVQTVYEQTLQSNQLSPTTDQLAKRLSRELKIRRSAEQKIIRSPSARKIGSMRRKSLEKSGPKVTRHQSWHIGARDSIPRANLKRGKPNTVLTGLPVTKEVVKNVCNLSGSSDKWVSGENFFHQTKTPASDNSNNSRASLARLRCQNAGMVLAKAKLFDQLKDSSGSSSNSSLTKSLPRVKVGTTKIGSSRNTDNRLSYRVRALKYEDRKIGKKSMSPRRRNGQLSHKAKLQIVRQYMDSCGEKENVLPLKYCNRIERLVAVSPKYSTPQIKKTLNVRSPKRLCRTPVGVERSTPLRVRKTPVRHHV